MGRIRCVRFSPEDYAERRNPTADDAIARADAPSPSPPEPEQRGPNKAAIRQTGIPELHQVRLKPMKISRLIEAGPPYTLAEQARVLYHQLGDPATVADRIGQSKDWTEKVLAYDMAQRQELKAAQ